MRRTAIIAVGGLAISAACFAAVAHTVLNDVTLPFWGILESGTGRDGSTPSADNIVGYVVNRAGAGNEECGARGDTDVQTRGFAWDGGDSFSVDLPGTIRYRRGSGDQVRVKARAWVLDHVRVDGGRIRFNCQNLNNMGEIEITLPGGAISNFAVSGASKVYLEDIQENELKITANGAAKIEVSGQADSANLSVAGAADVDMGRLAVKRLVVSVAGAGKVDVSPQDSATITIAGVGLVRLLTEPKDLSTHVAGLGRIVHDAR